MKIQHGKVVQLFHLLLDILYSDTLVHILMFIDFTWRKQIVKKKMFINGNWRSNYILLVVWFSLSGTESAMVVFAKVFA